MDIIVKLKDVNKYAKDLFIDAILQAISNNMDCDVYLEKRRNNKITVNVSKVKKWMTISNNCYMKSVMLN